MSKPEVTESHLPVPGATLFYKTILPPTSTSTSASTSPPYKPLLLFIPAANGTTALFERLLPPHSAALSSAFHPILYDRRGFSRSPLSPPTHDPGAHPYLHDGAARLARDADDAAALIEHVYSRLSPSPSRSQEPGQGKGEGEAARAYVFGSSSGARVALELLSRHPGLVARCVAHEPPVADPSLGGPPAGPPADAQADGGVRRRTWEENVRLQKAVGEAYGAFRGAVEAGAGAAQRAWDAERAVDHRPVIEAFARAVGTAEDTACLRTNMLHGTANAADIRFWFDWEFGSREGRGLPGVVPDYERLARVGEGGKLVIALGRENRGRLIWETGRALAERVGGLKGKGPGGCVEMVAGHMSYWTDAERFAAELRDALLEAE